MRKVKEEDIQNTSNSTENNDENIQNKKKFDYW